MDAHDQVTQQQKEPACDSDLRENKTPKQQTPIRAAENPQITAKHSAQKGDV